MSGHQNGYLLSLVWSFSKFSMHENLTFLIN